ncbi:MAG: endolytic transglycosylase MltG [Patescibacteria group bacterium]|jgi:UPF0755 protein|nr:endolytic transglycosylase MltG [Patescibacteria group bacterium]
MTKFNNRQKYRKIPRRVWFLLLGLIILFLISVVVVRKVYYVLLEPVSNQTKTELVNIRLGSTVKQIADLLDSDHLIKSSWAAQLYINSNNYHNKLQAGNYLFSANMGTIQIVNDLVNGRVATNLVTILPGTNIFKLKADFKKYGYNQAQINNALNINNYRNLKVMSFVPSNVNTLEGMLWPDSFERISTTPLSTIIGESLNEMGQHLTPSIQASFAAEGLTTYQGIILASIIDQEVSNPSDQAKVAQVFLSRLSHGMNLGSDVTAYYGDLTQNQPPNLGLNTPYNTLLHKGLPPTPISTISASSLWATSHPANTNWLYFVTGDNGVTYYSSTLAQQQQNTALYCHKLCSNP